MDTSSVCWVYPLEYSDAYIVRFEFARSSLPLASHGVSRLDGAFYCLYNLDTTDGVVRAALFLARDISGRQCMSVCGWTLRVVASEGMALPLLAMYSLHLVDLYICECVYDPTPYIIDRCILFVGFCDDVMDAVEIPGPQTTYVRPLSSLFHPPTPF